MAKGNDRKPRNEYIYGTTKGPTSEFEISVDQQTGEISFTTPMTNVYSETTYDRPKGPKVLSRVPQSTTKLTFANSAAFQSNYDFRCAVDTNTKSIRGKRISVVGVLVATPSTVPGATGLRTYWKFDVPFCLEYVELKAPPENFGWLAAWEYLLGTGKIDRQMKVGMIVDSDLGNINDYNQRKKPIFDTISLPPNVQLLYASSDAAKGDIINKSLAIADSVSRQSLQAIGAGTAPFNEKRVDSPWFEGHRIIWPNLKTT